MLCSLLPSQKNPKVMEFPIPQVPLLSEAQVEGSGCPCRSSAWCRDLPAPSPPGTWCFGIPACPGDVLCIPSLGSGACLALKDSANSTSPAMEKQIFFCFFFSPLRLQQLKQFALLLSVGFSH